MMTFVRQSTGWATETIVALIIVIALAGAADLGTRYGMPVLSETASQLLTAGLGVVAAFLARRREHAKREAQEAASARSGA